MKYIVCVLFLLLVRTVCVADTVGLRDGTTLEGQIIEERKGEIVLQMGDERIVIAREDIVGITREDREAKIVLKSGKTIEGKLISESRTTILLQTALAEIEIAKINIKTLNGRPVVLDAKAPPKSGSGATVEREVLIPAGDFLMGDSRDRANIVHKVQLDAYWIDRYEVTNGQYRLFLEATGHPEPQYWEDERYNGPDQPVVGVTWEAAHAYCDWVDKRLPTEAEWEKAARGESSRLYPWGDTYSPEYANTKESNHSRSMPGGNYPMGVSPYGLYDMAGNVWEWCSDGYAKGYYKVSPTRNPTGPEDGKERVIRGGSWSTSQVDMAHRRGLKATRTYPSLGFRCARTP